MKNFPRLNEAKFQYTFSLEQIKLLLVATDNYYRQSRQDSFLDKFKSHAQHAEHDWSIKFPDSYFDNPENLQTELAQLVDLLTYEFCEVRARYASVVNEYVHQYCTKTFDPEILAIPDGQKIKVLSHG